MTAVQDILSALNLDQLAEQLGTSPEEAKQAAEAAVPALIGGLQANAADPAGAASITEALSQHGSGLIDGGVDLNQVDVADGERITSHIFGANQEAVVNQLGGLGGGAGLIGKLLPMLAPVVMSFLASKFGGGAQAQAQAQDGGQGGGISDMLGGLLGGGSGSGGGGIMDAIGGLFGGGSQGQSGGAGGGIMDALGGLLGGGRR